MGSRTAAVTVAVGCLLVACGAESASPTTSSAPPTAAEPAVAGTPTAAPVGSVVPLGNAPEGIVVGASGVAAVAVRGPDGVVLFDAATGAQRRRVQTPSAARHLSLAGPDGPVLVPQERSDELLEMDLADGRITTTVTGVGHRPHDAAMTTDGTIVVTNEGGGGVVFLRDGRVAASLPAGPPQPGGVAAVGGYAAVADVRGNGVWVYDGRSHQQVAQAPVGRRLTHALALSGDLVAFADTDGDAVFLERIDPQLTQVARVDAPGKPYGLACDGQRRRLYVTLTAKNLLRVVDVADPAHSRVLGDVPTVQQPNSVAVDPYSGAVLVTGSDPGAGSSVQIVAWNLLPH
jgi:DNA-binding beta-propeller fold protein YncE